MENQARAVPLLQKVMSVAINMLLYLHGIWSIKFVHCSIRHLSTMGEDLQVSLLEYIKRVSGDLLLKRKFISSIATMKKVFDQIVRDLLEEMLLDMETMDILGQQASLKTPVKHMSGRLSIPKMKLCMSSGLVHIFISWFSSGWFYPRISLLPEFGEWSP
ncbi:uncharacterized protein LOC131249998 isoform X4 [Magnolia sinica]|uniref:uncharacterized protein LOC131249998 isoform X4 n=1 Tax=Magnolia sinica TaxID=86752 RepID=UPI00265AEE3E|nr:uncharacterized protein LOC131249998 isoform X4 [Magnolia sinica]